MSNPYVYPRPEYPRPDFQRGTVEGMDWLNLNGPWQFRFDGDRRGEAEGWFQPDDLEWREQIIVPFCWESLAAWGEGDAAGNDNYYSTRVFRNPLEVTRLNHRYAPRYEVGWYRRRIQIPNDPIWEGKRIILTIGAADFFTDAWCNGKHLGHHEGGYTPFEFDLTDAMERDSTGRRTGLLVLRVEDPMDNHEQPVGKQWRWYTTTSGIWQTVYIEPRSPSCIRSYRVLPDIDHSQAHFRIVCENASDDCIISVEIDPPRGAMRATAIPVRGQVAENKISIRPLLIWNPNEPHLYKVTLRLERGRETLDVVRSYFGMRKLDSAPAEDPTAPAVLRLNGVPRYLRGALHQSYYPEGVYTAADAQTYKNDILYAKKVGFNFLRIHIKIDDPILLYYADALGMMLMADFPNFGEGGDTPLGRRRFETMMREAIDRDFNHPSIVAWCLFNETWGFGGQVEFVELFKQTPGVRTKKLEAATASPAAISAQDPSVAEATEQQAAGISSSAEAKREAERKRLDNISSHAWVQSMWELAKQLDPTRLVEDMSVVHWEHLDYFAHGDTDINSWHFYINDYARAKEHISKIVNATYPGSTFNYVPGFEHKGQPLINSEYGGVGALDGDRDVSWSFKFLTNELRRHGQISAYIYTELHDVEWEYNGFLNYDRTPKEFGYDPTLINESDCLPIDAPPIQRCQPGQIMHVEVASSHYSTHPQTGVRLQWRLAGMDSRGCIHHDLDRGCVPIAFPHRRVAHAHTIELRLPQSLMLCTLSVEALRTDGSAAAKNFVQFFVSAGYPPEREEQPRLWILRAHPGAWVMAQWSGGGSAKELERQEDLCYGFGHGFFEWALPVARTDLQRARRLRILCEASSRRSDSPQTDDDHFPSTLRILLNGIPVYQATLANHPHDTRGALSYLRGGKGAYGYLAHATAEGELLRQIIEHSPDDHLTFRCSVPEDELAQGGLTVYGAECGRYPVGPSVVLEW
ncbi:MAG: sugar-binding domain-containing protein [Verrucomicrobiota bacterium]